MHDSYRSDRSWCLKLKWGRWYSNGLQGYTKSIRRSDLIMSAMFLAASNRLVRVRDMIDIIGFPKWIEGTVDNGLLYYDMHKRVDLDHYTHYMLFMTKNGILHKENGSNLRLQFKNHSNVLFFEKHRKIRNLAN